MNTTGKRIIQKILAIFVIITMTMADFAMVGTNLVSYAIDLAQTNNENVVFKAYFSNENGALETTQKIDAKDLKLSIDLSVKNDGYLTDGKIQLDEGANFKFKEDIKDAHISKIENNTIYLNQINDGDTVKLDLGIEFYEKEVLDVDYLNKTSTINLSGKYINSKNVENNKTIQITGKAEIKINWLSKDDIASTLETSLLTNAKLTVEGAEKKIVQVLVNSKLNENSYPVKSTNIELNIEKQPENITVQKRTSAATNGDKEFTQSNYTYTNGVLNIKVENGQEGNISWQKNAEDIFVVTLTYPSTEEISGSKVNVKSNIETYDQKQLLSTGEIIIDQDVDGMITAKEIQSSSKIGKGKIYTGEEKTYSTTTELYINYEKAVDSITIEEQKAMYASESEEKTSNIQFTKTTINKAQFLAIFGDEGTLNIQDQSNNTVATISKNSETDEQGNIVVLYSTGVTNIKVISTRPIQDGTLKIVNEKSILKADYSREEIKTFTKIKDSSKITYTKNNAETETKTASSEVALQETSSKAYFNVEQSSLTTTREDQELHITVRLESNDESRDLYKNPEIRIKLPKQITGISTQAKLLYGNGLSLEKENFKILEENNQFVIYAKLVGEQTTYPGEALEGTTLLLNAKVRLDKLSTNSEEEIILNYTNENSTSFEDNGTQKLGINIVSESSMILTSAIDEYNISTVGKEEDKEVTLEANVAAKTAKVKMQIANNEGTSVTNAKIIGKIANVPEKITKTSAIRTNFELAKVYYTIVENPTADLNNNTNGWTTENLNNAKNFMVIIDKLENGESVNLSYDISIAKDLGYNVVAETQFKVIYNNSLTGAEKQAEATKIVLSSGKIAEVKLSLTAEVAGNQIKDGAEVKAGEIIAYTAKVTNSGKEKAENIVLNVTIPDNTTLVEVNPNYGKASNETTVPEENKKYFIEKTEKQIVKQATALDAGRTLIYTYMVKVNSNLTEQKQVATNASVKYKDNDATTSIFNSKLVPGNLELSLRPKAGMTSNKMTSNYNYEYILYIQNNSNVEQKNVQVTLNKNDLIQLIDVEYEDKDLNEPNYVDTTFTIDSIPAKSGRRVIIYAKIKPQMEGLNSADISAVAKDSENKEYRSIQLSNPVSGINIETELTASSGETGYLHPGDDITYTIRVKNIGEENAETLTINDNISNYLNIETVKLNGNTTQYEIRDDFIQGQNYSTLVVSSPLKANEETKLEIKAKVDEELNTEELLKVVNKASVYNDILLSETPEKIAYIESLPTLTEKVQDETEEGNNSNNNNNNNNNNGQNGGNSSMQADKYIISGTAWEDTNQNGARDSGEKLLEGINVYAINVANNKTATDSNGINISAKTNAQGFYTLANMPKGQYIIAFEYDNQKYTTTIYQAEGVSADKNSDAVKSTKIIDGVEKTLAYTDSINLTEGKANIDLGLAEAKIFDLELEKVVTKMVVTNKEGTKTYNFNNSKLAKTEIRSKYLKGSNVAIEYKLIIRNKGEVAGYAKSVVDYIPSSLNFSSNLNKDWYQRGSYIYNASLANTIIEPGQTKELTLTLTKAMTETNTGLTNNKAEIESTYNVLGIADKDSTPGNNQKNEDDTGSADILINPSTGATVSYVALTLSTLIVICGIAYLINKKLLTEKIKI